MSQSEPHKLIVTHVESDGQTFDGKPKWFHEWEVRHPETCPKEVVTDDDLGGAGTSYYEYTCGVGHELSHVGLDGLTDMGRERIEPGEYWIVAWHNYDAYSMEHDGGLEFVAS